ncbi:MAG TPA: glycosyltransferase [Blastocatellia bacterium]|jgi:glycosyltransferase involved in cell wall biosynthesis
MSRKVLHLIGSFHEGGSERQAIQLARLLKAGGRYQVHIACMDASGALRDEVDRIGFGEIPEFRLTSFYNRNAIRQVRRFARWLREREISIVHTHDFYTNVFGLAGAALARVPVRIASRRETVGWRTAAQKFVERRAYNLAHTIVANARAVRDQLVKEGVRQNKITIIHNSLDLARVCPREAQRDDTLAMFELARGNNIRFVTMVANLRHPVKNHAMFLRAARRVSQSAPEARFIIAGEGELMTTTRALAEDLGLGSDVFFIGRSDRVAELLALSDVCVLASRAEGFSNSILEYMAAARPVVATDVGGASEAVRDGETGHLVPSDDDEAMADRIISLLCDPQRARAMGERGRKIIEQNFSCEAQLEKTENLYDRMLARALPALPQSLSGASEKMT